LIRFPEVWQLLQAPDGTAAAIGVAAPVVPVAVTYSPDPKAIGELPAPARPATRAGSWPVPPAS
jgi:hypothetical protein